MTRCKKCGYKPVQALEGKVIEKYGYCQHCINSMICDLTDECTKELIELWEQWNRGKL